MQDLESLVAWCSSLSLFGSLFCGLCVGIAGTEHDQSLDEIINALSLCEIELCDVNDDTPMKLS